MSKLYDFCKIYQKEIGCWKDRKRQKGCTANLFSAIQDGLLSRKAKIRLFKGILQRFKGSKPGPRL